MLCCISKFQSFRMKNKYFIKFHSNTITFYAVLSFHFYVSCIRVYTLTGMLSRSLNGNSESSIQIAAILVEQLRGTFTRMRLVETFAPNYARNQVDRFAGRRPPSGWKLVYRKYIFQFSTGGKEYSCRWLYQNSNSSALRFIFKYTNCKIDILYSKKVFFRNSFSISIFSQVKLFWRFFLIYKR